MNIAVIFGGISTERNVSIAGGKSVIEALRTKGHNVIPVDPAFGKNIQKAEELIIDTTTFPTLEELNSLDTRNYIEAINSNVFDNVDVAFIVLHGKNGEDGLIQALLELRGIPYTGSKVKSCAIAIDKATSKNLFGAAGLLTPEWVHLHKSDIENEELLKQIRKGLGNQIVIKPNYQGSSIGITIVKNGNLDEIHQGVKLAAEYSDSIIIERFIEGREITVGILGGEALPIVEIIPEEDYYDYKHKYTKGHTRYECPADIPEDIAEFAQSVAVICNNIIGAEGFARVDFRLTDEGEPYLLELNSIPGFTSTSLVPMAAKQIGLEFPELCEKIIDLALNKE
ncbi:MAG: D-alanine--D-alanine ligase family protein [Candidatus Kapaibacteriota bacterium]